MIRAAMVVLGLVVAASCASAADCVQPAGMAIGPIVPTADAARQMYRTIVDIRHDLVRPTNDIVVHDEGDHWEVFQYPKRVDYSVGPDNAVPVVIGDHTLALEIGKCNARTVGYYQR
jgi:hypothetical protein